MYVLVYDSHRRSLLHVELQTSSASVHIFSCGGYLIVVIDTPPPRAPPPWPHPLRSVHINPGTTLEGRTSFVCPRQYQQTFVHEKFTGQPTSAITAVTDRKTYVTSVCVRPIIMGTKSLLCPNLQRSAISRVVVGACGYKFSNAISLGESFWAGR